LFFPPTPATGHATIVGQYFDEVGLLILVVSLFTAKSARCREINVL